MAKGKVQINEASREEIAELPGIGAATAATLIKLRDERGGFKSASELEEVPGIGAQTLESIRPHITVSKPSGSSSPKGTESETAAAGNGAKQAIANGQAAASKVVEAARTQADVARGTGVAQAETVRRSFEAGAARAERVANEASEVQHDLAGAARQAQEVWFGLMQEQMSANMQAAQRLVSCRSPQDVATVQVEYLRSSMERFMHGSARAMAPAAQVAGTWWSPERWQQLVRR